MKRKTQSQAWKEKGLAPSDAPAPYSKSVGTNHVNRPNQPIPQIKCPRCGMMGHSTEAHFDTHQFYKKPEIRDEYGDPIRNYKD